NPNAFVFNASNYKLEGLVILTIIFYIINYFIGSAENKTIIKKLEEPIKSVLKRHFYSANDERRIFEIDSPSDVLIYASGRRNCVSLQGHVQLKVRQDLISLANDFLADNNEQISFEIVLDQDKADGFVFAVTPKNKSKFLLQDRHDISSFTTVLNSDKVDSKTVVFSETSEATNLLLSTELPYYLNKKTGLLSELYISDQPDKKPDELNFTSSKKLTAVLRIPKLNETGISQLVENIEFVFHLIDVVCESIKLKPDTLKKLEKNRVSAYKDLKRKEEIKKQEEALKAAALKKKIERESIERLPADQRRKAEEKLKAKAEKKKNQKRIVMK
ncbi:Coiled-coil domain-containing protein 47, partial [Smittium culicis]